MAFINNNYGAITVDKQVNITTPPPGATRHTDSTPPDADKEEQKDPMQLSNRQVVIMMAALMDISLSRDYTNQKQLARFLSSITGRSTESLRQTIMKLAREGVDTNEARRDCNVAADAIEPFCKTIAERIRNDAQE